MFELVPFIRALAFSLFYAGVEFRYVNRRDAEWTKSVEGFFEKPAFWKISPYQAYLLLPIFVIAGYATQVTAWGGNTLFIAVSEDIAYFVWRGRWVEQGEWTTTLFGSFRVGRYVFPMWWIPGILVVLALYLLPA